MTTIKAVVYHGPRDVRCEVLPIPDCNPGEIRVQVDACAVCGSDWKAYKSGNPRMRPPITMGHEFTGLIERIGAGVSGHFGVLRRVPLLSARLAQPLQRPAADGFPLQRWHGGVCDNPC